MTSYLTQTIFLLSILCFISCEKDKKDTPPDYEITACFTTTGSNFLVNEAVTFTNCSENGSHYWWSFDDQDYSSSKEENPVFTYTKAGTYTVNLVASYKEIVDYNGDMIIDDNDNLTEPIGYASQTITIVEN